MNKSSRLAARVTPEIHALLQRAAELKGRSVSDFVIAAAQEAAEKTISESEILMLSRTAQERFLDIIVNPPEPTSSLREAFKRHKTLVR